MKIFKRTLLVIGILLGLLMLSLAVLSYFVVTPERITPIVLRIANEQLNADINFEELDLTIFSSFPNVGITLKNGSIVAHNDTILYFANCKISLRPMAYIQQKRISINSIEIDKPCIYAHIDQSGQNNWDILPIDTTTVATTTDTTAQALPDFGIRKLQLSDAKIIYSDNREQQLLAIDGLQLTLSARQRKDTASLRLELDIATLNFQHKGKQLFPSIPVTLSAQLRQNNNNLQIRQAALTIATLDFNIAGQLQWNSITGAIDINTDFSLKTPAIADVLTKISAVLPAAALLKTSGAIAVKGAINGTFSDKSFPVIDAEIRLAEGKLRSALNPNKPGIELLEIDGITHIDINKKTPSTLQLKRFVFHGPSTKLDVSGKVNHLFTDPEFYAQVDADIDFTNLAKDFSFIDSAAMQGHIRSNLTGEFALSNLLNRDIGKVKIQGEINVDSLLLDYPKHALYVSAPIVRGLFGTNNQDTIRGQLRESLLRGTLTANNFALKWDGMQSNMRGISAAFSASAPADSISVAPVYTNLRINNLNYTIPADSLRIRTVLASGSVRIGPQPGNPTKPLFNVRLSLDTLRARLPEAFVMLNRGNLSAQIKERTLRRSVNSTAYTASRSDSTETSTTGSASGMRASRRDSLTLASVNDDVVDMQLKDKEVRDMLRQWDFSATLEAKAMRVRTPFFPLRTSVSEGIMEFKADTLRFSDIAMQAGKSAMQVNGAVAGIRQALLRNGKISADLQIAADTLDLNEITLALVAASKYTELQDYEKQEITQNLEKSDIVPTDEVAAGVFIIPKNIDLKIRTNIKHAIYTRMTVENLRSIFYLRNHTLEMPRMRLQSNLGDIQMSMVYQAMDTKGASIGLDMDLQQIQVKQLIASFPILDSLTPMLRSFEGVVDCNLTTVANLDSLMNVEFPSATASCYLKGKYLVLMDGETFSDIAKTLRFKNKERNLVDSLSVEIVMEDNRLLVFPFQLNLDRYQVAVGGTQHLNLSFDYHITVLKSPIPFRFGLNVSGNPDKYKIRLAKAKYTNLFKPAKTTSLSNTQLNIRQEFQSKLRSDIQAIIAQAGASQAPVRLGRQRQSEMLNNADVQDLLVTKESEIVSESTEGIVDETEDTQEEHSQQDSNLRPTD